VSGRAAHGRSEERRYGKFATDGLVDQQVQEKAVALRFEKKEFAGF